MKAAAFPVFLLFAFINWWNSVQPFDAVRFAAASRLHLGLSGFSLAVFLSSWTVHLRDTAIAALILASAAGFGGWMAGWLGGGNRVSSAVRMAVGLGLLGMAVFGFGLAGIEFKPLVLLLVIAGACPVIRRSPAMAVSLAGKVAGFLRSARGIENMCLLLALALMGLSCLVMSLGPEGGWDAVFYHMRLPKLYAMAHKVVFVGNIFPSNYPQGVEMLYLLGWLGGGEGAAKLVNLSFWFLSGWALWELSRHLARGTAFRAVALALTMPVAGALASEGYIDLGLTFFELAALGEVLRGRAGTAGFLIGCAMATKYTGIFALVAAIAAGRVMGMGGWKTGAMAACGLIPLAPWLAKNAWFTGDPAAPFLSGFLGKLDWVDGISQAPLRTVHGLMPSSLAGAVGSIFGGLWIFLKTGVFGVFTPFVLGFLPVLIFPGSSRADRGIRVYGLVFTLLVLALAPDGRYWQPAAFVLCIPLAASWSGEAGGRGYSGRIAGIFAVASALAGSFYHFGEMDRSLPGTYSTALGLEPPGKFYAAHRSPDGYADAVSFINSSVPRGERVAVVADVQAYLIDRGAFFDSDAGDSRRWLDNLALVCRSPQDWEKAFRRWKCRTVLYLNGRATAVGHPRDWTSREAGVFGDFWRKRVRRIYRSKDCSVYGIGPPDGPGLFADLPGPQERWLLELQRTSRWPGECGRVYSAALKSGAESGRLHMIFGGLMMNAGSLRESAAALERAVALAPDEPTAWYWLALARVRTGEMAKARKSLARAIELEPDNVLAGMLSQATR